MRIGAATTRGRRPRPSLRRRAKLPAEQRLPCEQCKERRLLLDLYSACGRLAETEVELVDSRREESPRPRRQRRGRSHDVDPPGPSVQRRQASNCGCTDCQHHAHVGEGSAIELWKFATTSCIANLGSMVRTCAASGPPGSFVVWSSLSSPLGLW